MIGAVYSFLYLVGGYVLIFSGMAFSNKQLLPSIFDGLYDNTTYIVRVIIFSIFLAIPANYLIPKAFQVSSASVAGPMLLAVILLATIVYAMILDKVTLTLPVIGAASGALFFCCLTAWLLEGQRAVG